MEHQTITREQIAKMIVAVAAIIGYIIIEAKIRKHMAKNLSNWLKK